MDWSEASEFWRRRIPGGDRGGSGGSALEVGPVLVEFEHRFTAVFWAFQKDGSACEQQGVGELRVGLLRENVAGTDADADSFPIFG